MSRIRTIKPDFFRHEALQDLEKSNLGAYPMLVFAGLWTKCDAQGVFEDRPRQLKLDLLPFLDFDMDSTIALLESAGLLVRYEAGGKRYGLIGTFQEHQRLSGKEAGEAGKKYPLPRQDLRSKCEEPGKQQGSTGDQLESQEKEREREEEKELIPPLPPEGDAAASEVLAILKESEVFKHSACKVTTIRQVMDDFPDVPPERWPVEARTVRDDSANWFGKQRSAAAGNIPDPASSLRRHLNSMKIPQTTPTRRPSSKPNIGELREQTLALMAEESVA